MISKTLRTLTVCLALILSLSGAACFAQEGDSAAPEATPAVQLDDNTVVAVVGGEEITLKEVMEGYQYYAQQYAAYGVDLNDTATQQQVLQTVVNTLIQGRVVLQKARELGLDKFSEEENKKFDEDAKSTYEGIYNSYRAQVPADGKSDADIDAETKKILDNYGYTEATVRESLVNSELYTRIYNYAVEGVAVTEEEIKAAYDEKVAAAKESYDKDLAAFGNDMMGGKTIYYVPEGYRTVKHILIKSENASALKELETTMNDESKDAGERSAALDKFNELKAEDQKKLDEVLAKIEAGEDFQALIDQYGEDGGMKAGSSFAESGYYVAEGTSFDAAFLKASLALEKVGDVSDPVLSSFGWHIIRYNADVPSEVKPFEDLRDAISEELLSSRKSEAYQKALSEWSAAAAVEIK